jgi:hypothetical protein
MESTIIEPKLQKYKRNDENTVKEIRKVTI